MIDSVFIGVISRLFEEQLEYLPQLSSFLVVSVQK
jgi:hypothetical protein